MSTRSGSSAWPNSRGCPSGATSTSTIDLYYGDESGVSLDPCVPYAWQSADERVAMPAAKGSNAHCFALLSRDSRCLAQTAPQPITGAFVAEQLDRLSLSLDKPTVVVLDNVVLDNVVLDKPTVVVLDNVVLDNAPLHHSRAMRQRRDGWQGRGLFVFYLPAYSPHLNIAEALWRKMKYEWLRPEDYAGQETLRYQVWQALKAVGGSLTIRFSPFRQSEGLIST